MHITIGIPLYNNMPIETFLSMLRLFDSIDKKIIQYNLKYTKNYPIHYARNHLAEQFLKNKNSDYLLFLDSDMIFIDEKNFIKRLLEIDADISSATAFKKEFPYEPTMYQKAGEKYKSIQEYKENEIIEIDAVGMACCLIKRKVFETINPPWFEFITLEDDFLGEDLTFCKKVKEAGFTIKVDTGLVAAHVGGIINNKTFKGMRDFRKRELYPQIREDFKRIIEQMGDQQILNMIQKINGGKKNGRKS